MKWEGLQVAELRDGVRVLQWFRGVCPCQVL